MRIWEKRTAMKPLTVYAYKNCSTCRNAKLWLEKKKIPFQEKAIRETPPTKTELKTMLAHLGGDLKKLFNTSGEDYRSLGLKDKLPKLSQDEAFDLLTKNGNLVKRPFVLGEKTGLVGFNEEVWKKIF